LPQMPFGLDLIHRLRRSPFPIGEGLNGPAKKGPLGWTSSGCCATTDGALLLVPVGASPEEKAYLAMKLNEGAKWCIVQHCKGMLLRHIGPHPPRVARHLPHRGRQEKPSPMGRVPEGRVRYNPKGIKVFG